MSELKPGDKVWIGVNVGLVLADDTAWYTDLRGAPIKGCFDTSYVPDVPNLAAVARVLAAHPGIGEALQIIGHDFGGDEQYEQYFDQLFALAAALNGGTP